MSPALRRWKTEGISKSWYIHLSLSRSSQDKNNRSTILVLLEILLLFVFKCSRVAKPHFLVALCSTYLKGDCVGGQLKAIPRSRFNFFPLSFFHLFLQTSLQFLFTQLLSTLHCYFYYENGYVKNIDIIMSVARKTFLPPIGHLQGIQ